MDPISLIVAALVKGAAGVASQAVADAYAGLKNLVLGRVSQQPAGPVAVEQHEEDPETWQAPLVKALTAAGAQDDPELVAAAQALLALADPQGSKLGAYTVAITASGERSVAAQTINGPVSTGDANLR